MARVTRLGRREESYIYLVEELGSQVLGLSSQYCGIVQTDDQLTLHSPHVEGGEVHFEKLNVNKNFPDNFCRRIHLSDLRQTGHRSSGDFSTFLTQGLMIYLGLDAIF